MHWLLAKATSVLGKVRVVDLRPEQVCACRASLPEGSRFAATQALRQVLNRAVAWELIDFNPAKRGVDNPSPRSQEKRPFESWAEIDAVAGQLGPVCGPMVVFAAATGLRSAELFALEQRDLKDAAEPAGGAAPGDRARGARPSPTIGNPLLFQAPRGGYIDLGNFRRGHWKLAQVAAGIDPLRQPYDLRHTYATFALRAGVSIFDLSRFMGASLTMIDLHYGHLARDGREHAVALLDALAADETAWTFGGRRVCRASSRPLTEEAVLQEL